MKYEMKVTIANPDTPEGMMSDLFMKLSCIFAYDAEQYGNGHWLKIKGNEGFENYIDLRYDKDFDRNNKTAYLEKWARNYWSGKNGAYYVKSLEIIKA
jgi:hypothetical protein